MIDFCQVGNKITKYRKASGLTQDELADKLYVTRQALSKWENGISVPSIDTLIDLSHIFNVTIDDLLCLDEKNDIIEADDIFKGHSHSYVMDEILSGHQKLDLPEVISQMSPEERMTILKAIKDGHLTCNFKKLEGKLTSSESHFLNGGK